MNFKPLLVLLVVLLSGCSFVPSFWDDNESRAATDLRYSIAKLDCTKDQAPQIKILKDNIGWFSLYMDSKKTSDVQKMIAPMILTVDDFYKRSLEKQGGKVYCENKKAILSKQSKIVADAVMRRF